MDAFGTKGEAIGDYQTLLEQGRSSRNLMSSAVQNIDNIIKTSAKDPSLFGAYLTNLENDVATYDSESPMSLTDIIFEKKPEYQNAKTWNQLAKEKGYNSLKEAVAAGEYFEDVAPGQIKNMFKWAGPSNTANLMTYEYVGNPKVEKFVGSMFSSPEDLLNLDPAYYGGWDEVPGFRAGDVGVQIDVAGNRQARLVKAGDQILYEVPITWKQLGVTQSGRVTVVPSAALELVNQKALKNLDIITDTDDPADIQTNATIKSARFDRVYKDNSLNDYTIQNTPVTKGGKGFPLYPITYDATTNLVTEKVYDANSYGPKLKIAIVDASTGQRLSYLKDESGKEWYVDANNAGAADAAKVVLMQALGQ